jgi:amylovoran biosynthesis glycosyltransferase AmsB
MRFTVVIPSFNSSRTIPFTLDSLVRQSERDFEVVIVDDASKDIAALRAAIAPYLEHLSIRLLENARNMNGAYSRNRGIDAAMGEYVAFLDADDSWVPDRLETASRSISEQVQGRFVIYGQFELVREIPTGAILPRRGIRAGELVSDYVFAAGQLMQTSTFVCPADLARQLRFDEALSRHQDSDFMMRAQQQGITLVFQASKCALYVFNSVDLRRRIAEGRINSAFCEQWLASKAVYLSAAGTAGYNLTVYARILYLEGHGRAAWRKILSSVGQIGLGNMVEMLSTKVYTLYKTRLSS